MTTDKALAAIVKPLEWKRTGIVQDDPVEHFSAEVCGQYYEIWSTIHESRWCAPDMVYGERVGSLDEAKSAAQANYAASILSALDPAFLARVEKLEAENTTLLRLLEERDDIIARYSELCTKFVATLPIQGGQDGE